MRVLRGGPFMDAAVFAGLGVRPVFLVFLACGGARVLADNLAATSGVMAVADTEHRDRWGAASYPPGLVCDGNESTCWISDNWAGRCGGSRR
jgi:hypothetical protein